jgi:Cu(I)/Ag(I) efflux system membrane fusion protein
MGRITPAIAVVAAMAASYGLGRHQPHSQTSSRTGRHVIYYVDPMHPAYRSDKPGIAPDCGMQLEPVFAEDAWNAPQAALMAQLPAGAVGIDGATQQLLGIRVAPAERSGSARTLRVVGRVVPEDARVYRINSGMDGFIRETYNDSVGVQVRKDQKLASYYAPEILAPASGFLAANARVPGSAGQDGARTVPFPGALAQQGRSSLQGYTDRLRNLGMSDAQIKWMAGSGQLPESIDVVAPSDGFILARNISPGQHFMHETEFYRIADLSRVWVVAEVNEQEAPYLRSGGLAKITLKDEGLELPARITDSLPQSEAGGGTVKLRLVVDNPQFLLRPEMLVDVELPVRLPPAVTVPLDALVNSGERAHLCRARRRHLRTSRGRNRVAFWRTGRDPARASARRARRCCGHLSRRLRKPPENATARTCAGAHYRAASCRARSSGGGQNSERPKLRHAGRSSQGGGFRQHSRPSRHHLLFLFQQVQTGFPERSYRISQQTPGRRR